MLEEPIYVSEEPKQFDANSSEEIASKNSLIEANCCRLIEVTSLLSNN